jgi:ubiquinone/menaquinone biosynthesis C-methylase UbiE
MIKKSYEKYVLPKLLDCCCSTKPINYQRKKIVPNASGNILEIGIGSGLNLPYYEKSKINNLYGIDPSSELCDMAKKSASDHEIDVNLLINGAEEIELPKDSIDTVVMTYTLCTIPNPIEALKEIKRVMKADAKMLFCEHGTAPDKNILKWQNRINPIWGKLFGGCNINRDIPRILKESGFKINTLDQMYLPGTPKIVGYNYWGEATN